MKDKVKVLKVVAKSDHRVPPVALVPSSGPIRRRCAASSMLRAVLEKLTAVYFVSGWLLLRLDVDIDQGGVFVSAFTFKLRSTKAPNVGRSRGQPHLKNTGRRLRKDTNDDPKVTPVALFQKVREEKSAKASSASFAEERVGHQENAGAELNFRNKQNRAGQRQGRFEHDKRSESGSGTTLGASAAVVVEAASATRTTVGARAQAYFDLVESKVRQLRLKIYEAAAACKADAKPEKCCGSSSPRATSSSSSSSFGRIGECSAEQGCFAMDTTGGKSVRVRYDAVAVTDDHEDCLSRAIVHLFLDEANKPAEADVDGTKLLRNPITEQSSKSDVTADLGFATVALEKPGDGANRFVARWPVSNHTVRTDHAAPWYVKTLTGGVSKNVVIVVDRSWSMDMTKSWEDARGAALAVLESLATTDKFFLMTYQHPVQFAAFEFVHATAAHVAAAKAWLDLQFPIGGSTSRPDAEFAIGAAITVGTLGVVPEAWRTKISGTVNNYDSDDRRLPPDPASDASCPLAAATRCEKTMVLFISDENFNQDKFDHKHGTWLRNLLEATEKLEADEAPLENDIDPAVYLNVYRLDSSHDKEAPPPTVDGPYKTIAGQFDGEAEVTRWQEGALADRVIRYWQKLVNSNDGDDVTWSAHEDEEGYHLTACLPLALDYYVAAAGGAAADTVPPGLVCLDPRAALPISLAQLECHTDGFHEELANRLNARGCTAEALRQQRARRGAYCNTLITALQKDQELETEVFDFLETLHDVNFTSSTLSGAMEKALTLVPCIGCDLGKPISREDKTDPSVRYFAHTYPNGTEVDYLPSCPSKQDQAAAGDCSDYEKQWRQTYPHHALYHSEDDDGNGGALPTVQERANICNSTIIPPAVLLTQLGGGGVADEEVQALAKKMDVLGWVSGETSEEQETTSEADEASDACRVCLLFVVIFALLIIVVLLLFCCYRTAGAPQRGGGALVVDENIFAYTPAIAAERLDPGRVQRALVAAGFSAAFAATLAKQVASPAADRASLKWPLPGSPDFRALERLGLDFSAPETHALGVIRGILRKGLAVIKRREGGGRNLRGEPVLGTKELSLYNAEFQAAESAFLDLGLSPVGARKAARQVAGPVLDAEALNLTGLNELDVQRLEGELGLETGTDRARTDVPIEVGRVRKALRRLFGVDRGDPSRATDSDLRASPLLFATADEDFELAESLLRTAGASAACARKLAGDAAGPDLDATPLETQTLRALDIAVLRRELGLHATVDRAPEAMKLGLDATVDRAELDLGALREALRTRAVLAKRKGGKRKLKEELLFTTSQQDCRLAEAALVAAGMTSSGARKIAQDAAAPDLATERHLSAILSDDDMRILLQFLELDEVAEAGGVLTASVLRGAVRKAVGRHRGSGGAAGSPPLLTTFNLSYQTIENAFLSAGLTPGFARRLAQQTAAASVGGNEALVTPKTEADWRTLALLGLDFSQPECVGRVREFLQVMAAATISARCKDVVEMRVLSLDESQHRLQAAGFSEKMAGYVAAVIVRKAQQQGGARPGGAVEFLSGAERRELELCAESVEDRELFGIVGRAGLLPGFVYAGSRFPPQPDGKTDEWFAADDEIVIDLQAFALGAELGGAEVAHSVQGFEARRVGAERSPGNQAIALMPPRKDAYPDLRLGTLSSQRMRSGAPPSAVSDMMHLDDEQQTPTGTCGACVSWWQALVASCCGRSGRILQKGQWPPPEANFEEGDDREDAGKTPDGAISEDTQGEPGGAASGTDAVAESAKKGSKKSLGAAKKGTKKKSKAKIKSQTANEINVAFSSSVVVPAQIPQISSGMFPASERPPGEGLLNGDERATPADVDGAVLSSAPGSVSSAPGSGSSGSSRASGRTGGKKVGKTSKYRLGNKGTKNKLKAVGALSRGRSPPAEPVDPTSSAPASSTITSTAHAPAPPLPPGLIGQAIAALQDVGFDPQQAVLLSRKIAAVDAAELNERALTDGERAVAQKGLGGVNIPDLDELVEQLVAQKAVFFAEALSPESQAEAGAARDRGEPMSLLADRCADPVRGAAKRKWKLLANANKPKPKKNAAAG